MAATGTAGRAWDALGIGTVAVLGVLGVRRRYDADLRVQPASAIGEPLDLNGTHCIVTGASSGIGREVAWGLAGAGADRVEMACRDLGRCEQARSNLLSRCLTTLQPETANLKTSVADAASMRAEQRRACSEIHQRCTCSALDLADVSSVRAFVSRYSASALPVSSHMQKVILVNNAGIMGGDVSSSSDESTKDDTISTDSQLSTNHFGHFLLTRLLLPMMGPGSQIIMVGSRAHYWASLRIRQANGKEISSDAIEQAKGGTGTFAGCLVFLGLSWYVRYARSKLCNVLFAAELRRRYPEGPGCLVVSPGLVDTGLFTGVPSFLRGPLSLLAHTCFQTPQEGASHVLSGVAIALDGVEAVPPALYWHCGEPQRPSPAAEDPDLAAALWRSSEAVVGI